MHGNNSPPRSTPGTEPRPALQSTHPYICIVPLKFMNFCAFFLGGEGGNGKQCHSHPSLPASSLLSSRRATPHPAVEQGANTNCTKPTRRPPAKKRRFPVLRAPRQPWRQGDNQTHLRRAKMCTEMCATVRAGGGEKEQSWCAVTLQRERGAIMRSRLRSDGTARKVAPRLVSGARRKREGGERGT